jgi:hypothetical protein
MPASDKYNLDKSKKTILFHTNDAKLLTGFGKQAKNVLKYLYKTNKYNLIEFSNGYVWSDSNIKNKPWLTFGSLPDDTDVLREIQADPARQNAAGYGAEMIDKAIEEFNPDIYFGCEDAWAFNGFTDKKWWKLLNPVLQVTVDSLPILPSAIELAKLTPNFYTWATFAEKELNNLGHKHVKTIPGAIDLDHLFRLPDESINKLRTVFNLKDNFIIGFVFRNQLRKSIPNLLDGFVKFDAKYPEAKAKLLLHTSLEESSGWDIPRFIKEKNIDNKKVLFTHYCHSCHNYHIKPFNGHGVTCPFCKKANSCRTPNIKSGVSEQQLNEIINLFDVSAQIFNSGGLEVPIYEAKACEKITLVTNYSCGTDGCSPESAGLPLDWSEYREIGTNFIKASTCPISIANQLEKVYKMSPLEKRAMEQKARQYVLDNLSAEVVGKKFEQVFDSLPAASYSFKKEKKECNIHFEPDESLADKEWVESLYDNILNEKDSQGVIQWMQRLKTDATRADVLNYFCRVGASNNQSFFLDKMLKAVSEDNHKKIAFIVPEKEEEIIASTSLLPSIKKQYPDHNIYFFTKPEHFDLISGNPNIYKVLNYTNKMQDPLFFEGKGDSPKYFELAYAPLLGIRNNNYSRNNKDSIQYNIYQ